MAHWQQAEKQIIPSNPSDSPVASTSSCHPAANDYFLIDALTKAEDTSSWSDPEAHASQFTDINNCDQIVSDDLQLIVIEETQQT